jgi:hypothetical protein
MIYKTEVVMFCACTYIATLITPCYFVPVFFLGFMADKMSAVLYIKLKQSVASCISASFGDMSELKQVYRHFGYDFEIESVVSEPSEHEDRSGNMLFHGLAFFLRHAMEEKLLAFWQDINEKTRQAEQKSTEMSIIQSSVEAAATEKNNQEPDWPDSDGPPGSDSSESGSSESGTSDSDTDGEETKKAV